MMAFAQKASFVFYGAALAVTLAGFLFNKEWKFRYSALSLWAGWVFSNIYIGARWYEAGRAPMSNMYESLVFLVWAFVISYLLFRKFSGRSLDWLAPWTALVAVLTLGGASFFASDISPLMRLRPTNLSTLIMAGYGALLLSFWNGVSFMGAQDEAEKPGTIYRACSGVLYRLELPGRLTNRPGAVRDGTPRKPGPNTWHTRWRYI